MSKFSNGPFTTFNGPCKKEPVTPEIVDPLTQQEIVSIAMSIVNTVLPIGIICLWQVTDNGGNATMVNAYKPGWHLANAAAIDDLCHFDGSPLTTGEKDILKSIFPAWSPQPDPAQEGYLPVVPRLPKMDNGIIRTYDITILQDGYQIYTKEQLFENFYTKEEADAKFVAQE